MVDIALPEVAESHLEAEDIPLTVIHEDEDLIVILKPAGLVVHPAPGTPSGTLVNALLAHCGESLRGVGGERRPGIVHRLDKDTSGLMVAAKSDAAHAGLSAQFEAHSVERVYRAVCHGVPDAGDARLRGVRGVGVDGPWITVTTGLDRHRTDRQRQAVYFGRGRHAVTRLRVLKDLGVAAEVACRLETGRTHQIRVHMAHIGHGLVGDPVYGGRRKLPGGLTFSRQALHAGVLGFTHPVSGEHLRFETPLPGDMEKLLRGLEAFRD